MKKLGLETRKLIEALAVKHFIYAPSASIYGGISGLYDFGPLGCKLKNNIISFWREFFVLKENMYEIESATLTPEMVLKSSGHVDKFEDMMITDTKTNECYRADHLIEGAIERILKAKEGKLNSEQIEYYNKIKNKAGSLNIEETKKYIKELKITAPNTGNELTSPYYFNLMFSASIGPTGKLKGYLRPETAQGIFVNFKRLYNENSTKLPFAAAQVGTSYRNEISPRCSLLRVREFTVAEIEHFCSTDPQKKHHKFDEIPAVKINLWNREQQDSNSPPFSVTIKQALEQKIILNETMGFYLWKIFAFLKLIGIEEKNLRFRQHLKTEMAHYADDCWDAEIFTSYGWIECVGLADRSCYDLTRHSEFSKKPLFASIDYDSPKNVKKITIKPNNSLLGKTYKSDNKKIIEAFNSLNHDELIKLKSAFDNKKKYTLKTCEKEFEISPKMLLSVENKTHVESSYHFFPPVVEPSFGIGRIMYALLEHSLKIRENSTKQYLAINPKMAPVKCLIAPLTNDAKLRAFAWKIHSKMTEAKIFPELDESNVSIGRRYIKADERGVLFLATIDFESLEDKTFTLRYRDTTEQIRVNIDSVSKAITAFIDGEIDWEGMKTQFNKK